MADTTPVFPDVTSAFGAFEAAQTEFSNSVSALTAAQKKADDAAAALVDAKGTNAGDASALNSAVDAAISALAACKVPVPGN